MKVFILLLTIILPFCLSLDNGLGLTPPLGWNSWNRYGCNITEDIIKTAANALISTGLAKKGYNYVNIDDCWQIARDANGRIVEDKTAFPSGIKALVDYVHSLGLKFGLYSSAGDKTCQGRPGGLNYEDIDAQTYTEWGIDYFKYDNCFNEGISGHVRYPKMRDAIAKAGGKIYYSVCSWGDEGIATWGADVGNSWRTTGDIADNWLSFIGILDQQQGLEVYAKPGAWNDPDMLEVGNGGMTTVESQSHFALWAILKAPLLIGCDLSTIKPEDLAILKNDEVIAVNQDKMGIQAKRVVRLTTATGYLDTYAGTLKSNTIAIVMHNRSMFKQKMTVKFSDIGFEGAGGNIRDIINHVDYGFVYTQFEADVESHGVSFLTLHQYCLTDETEVESNKLKFLK